MSHGVIERILGPKREEIARLILSPPPVARRPALGLLDRLKRPPGSPLRLIAEVKLKSPSAGSLSCVLSPAQRAQRYALAGAAMISVLVDGPFFGGSYADITACRDALDAEFGAARPFLLCKEFVLHTVQLDHAVAAGADAVLLIARIVSPVELARLAREARGRGLTPLIEIATLDELSAARGAEAELVGVNARDLDTLAMDAARAARVLDSIDTETVAIHLSGLGNPEDVARVAKGRPDAALIGEALMRADDPTELLSAMVRAATG